MNRYRVTFSPIIEYKDLKQELGPQVMVVDAKLTVQVTFCALSNKAAQNAVMESELLKLCAGDEKARVDCILERGILNSREEFAPTGGPILRIKYQEKEEKKATIVTTGHDMGGSYERRTEEVGKAPSETNGLLDQSNPDLALPLPK